MDQNEVRTKSLAFAKRIVRAHQYLCEDKKEFVLSKQLLRSGTSIGSNIAESQYGSSRKDFLNKLYIALKECAETLLPVTICPIPNTSPYTQIVKNCVKCFPQLQKQHAIPSLNLYTPMNWERG